MRRAHRLLTSALILSLPASLVVPNSALADPQQAAQPARAAVQQAPQAPLGPLAPPAPAKVAKASTSTSGTAAGKPVRVRELDSKRTGSSKSYAMSDGTTQVELSTEPVHYKDSKGTWQDIDTKVTAGTGEDSFENAKNTFRSRFGKSSDRLVTFEADGASISLGAAGDKRKLTPLVKDSSVAFEDVFGTADVRYYVTRTGVKEDVVLTAAADAASEYTFDLHTSGLTAKEQADGSVGFFKKNGDNQPKYVIPAPNMFDSSPLNKLGQPGYSEKITQSISQQGGKTLLTLKPDPAWLTAKERVFPIVIDPTIVVVPDPAAAQDTSISEANPAATYGTNSTVLVGDDLSHNTWRGLLKFDTSMIPTTTTIRSADLNLHYGAGFGGDYKLPFAAVKVTSAWSESTATWASMNAAFNGTYATNIVTVDDQDTASSSYEGLWKDQSNASAVNGWFSYAPTGTTADTFTWDARVSSPGDYQVRGHYYPNSVRGQLPTTITGDTGSTNVTWNQTAGTPGPGGDLWYTLGTVHASPGKTARVRIIRQQSPVAATIPIADAVQWTKYSTATKQVGDRDGWHSYGLGSYVQSWVSNPASNFGVMLKAVDEAPATAPAGGLYYTASEDTLGGETAARPNLVITYDEPGVDLNPPSTINASGPELSWGKYVDPTTSDDDNLVEYQVFRGCRALPADGCTAPVSDYFSTTAPSSLQLVGTVPPDVTSFTDDTATPSALKGDGSPDAATYNYWVVAKTVGDGAGNGKAASNVQTVTMPREGRVMQSFSGDISDTTLSAATAYKDVNLSRPDGGTGNTRYWVQVGNNHPTYGAERGVFAFDTSSIKQGTKVTDARVELFSNYGSGTGRADFDLYGLTKSFVETEATWNKATSTITWTTAGGDYDSTLLASLRPDNNAQRLTFAPTTGNTSLLTKVQSWVDNPGDNHGLLLRTRDEAPAAAGQQLISITNGESPDTLFRPRLWIEHLAKNTAETYQADEMPERFVPGTTITTPVTVTNTSNEQWPAGLQLSYRWTEPGSTTDITVSGDRNFVPLGKALAPGEAVRLNLPIRTPINSDTGTKRLAYDIYLDLWTGSAWFSTTKPPSSNTTRPSQGCAVMTTGYLCVDRYVEDPGSNQLGLEKFLSYTGEETGGGSQFLTNLYSGNAVWSYDAWSNPSIGPSAFVRLAYNSQDGTSPAAGFGFSVQAATLTRLGGTLSVPSGNSVNNLMTFIDGDGTTHTYKLATQTSSLLTYTRPPGVGLDLTRDLTADADHQWVFTRPDGTRFYFNQDSGRQTAVVDRNGNTMAFAYDTSGRLTTVTDASNREVLTLGYEAGGTRKLVWIRDISGRALKFNYNTSSQLIKLEDGGAFDAATQTFGAGAPVKAFQFAYTDTSNNSNTKLISVKDPRNAETTVQYYTSTENSSFASWPKSYTDRRGNSTTFSYADPDGSAAKDLVATVTDVNGSTPSVTTYRMDGYGRTTSILDANQNATGGTKSTLLGWDSDHNVIRLQEPNDAVSTWEYDPKTGYPLIVRDAMAVKNNLPGVVLTYQTLTTGAKPTVLMSKTSTAGRASTFTYDANGNVKTVKNGLGFGPAYTYNPNGTLATATDARGNATQYGAASNYHASGYPLSITDPELAKTDVTYDDRGNVVQVKDAQSRVTTAEYDAFGRPTKITTPYDATQTPAVTRTTVTDYDLNDNVTKETASNGAQSVSTFDAADNVLTTTLPDNNTTGRQLAYTYDVLGRKVTETAPKGVATASDPNDFVTKYTYDRIGQVLKVETPFVDTDGSTKTPTTTYEYDLVGNQTTVIDPNRNASPATDYTSKTVYDLNHRPTAVTDAAGYTSKNVYDADGLVTSEINQVGNSRRTDYDAAGQPIAIHVQHTPIGDHQKDWVTTLTYDQVGNVTRETRPTDDTRPTEYYSETVYDKTNRPIQKKSAFDTTTTLYKAPSSTFIQYWPTGEVKAQSEPTFGSSGTQWTNFTYYDSGDIKTSTDPWQITTSYGYNQLGQQINRTLTVPGDAATRTQAWGYYPDGALQSRSDTAAQQPVDVMDNADTWQTTLTGTWATVTGGTNTQGSNYRTHAAAAVGTPEASDTFNWRVLPDVAGSFDVYASCPVRSDAATAATYTINHSTGTATTTVDQKSCTAANPWINLGNYSFPNGVAKTITLKPATAGVVSADAIKLVSTNPVPTRSFTYNYDQNGVQTEIKDTNPAALTDTFKVTTDGLARTTQVKESKGTTDRATTDYTYDLDSNLLSTNAQRVADTNGPAVGKYTAYSWDVRNLVATVKAGASPTGTLDTWSYTYDPRGWRSTITKPNGNITTLTYHETGTPRIWTEKTAAGQLVSSHSMRYNPDGDRTQDVAKVLQANSSGYLDQASNYTYTPARQLMAVGKTGVDKGDSEAYEYDAAGNATKQTIGATVSTSTYDRNRLTKTVTGSTTSNYRYDVFGRSTTTDVGTQVVEQNAYDGYDRLVRQQKFDTAGNPTFTRNQTYDPFDRVSFQSEKVGSAQSVSTRYTFTGLANQVALEEQKDSTGAYKVSKSYAYGASGENLSLVDTPVNSTTNTKSFYGTNPHGDVETLTNTTGQTTSTYRYTAYGQTDTVGTTGDDAITGNANSDADVVNPYRFNGKRFDGATGTYDMGFREYNPGLNRFLSRDMFAGALQDMALGTDPWNTNRYMFGGGNPISRVELTGHMNALEGGGDTPGSFTLPISTSDEDHNQQVKQTWTNFGLGAVQGTLEAGEQANDLLFPGVSTIGKAAGVPSGSQVYRNMVEKAAVGNTNSTAYDAGRWFGPMLIPTGSIGVTVKAATKAGKVAEGALEAAVTARAAKVVATQSIRKRGPVLSGVQDRVSGKIFFGQNTGIPERLHPALAYRLSTFKGPWAPGKGIPGSHAEINAINEGLLARPGARIEDFLVYNVRLRGAAQGDPIEMCANCAALLEGAEEVLDAGR